MRSVAAPCLAAVLVLAACVSSVAPSRTLTGTWQTPDLATSGGIQMQLKSGLTKITGTGQTLDPAQNVRASYTIQGTYQGASVYLSMAYAAGGTGQFSGTLTGDTLMQGTWTPPSPDTASVITLLKK